MAGIRPTPGIGIYIHIPFCRTRCPYCDFVSNAIPEAVPPVFIESLCEEIRRYDGPKDVASIFLGGGTPSLLSPRDLEQLFNLLSNIFAFQSPEITLEANPDDVTPELAQCWMANHVNRVSLGIQSFEADVLRCLGRRHDAKKAFHAAETVAALFTNWNMDLIFGVPVKGSWATTLETAVKFKPPHIAAYSLTYENGTPFGMRAHEALDEDAMLALYEEAETRLSVYDHYEISNFALSGFQCRHNLIYWHNEEYAGFGPGAYSYIGGYRMRNEPALNDYLTQPGKKVQKEHLTRRDQQVETLIQHFRLREGIDELYYEHRFGESVDSLFAAPLQRLQQRGLLRRRHNRILPTRKGFHLNNEIGLALVNPEEPDHSEQG